MTNKTLFLLLFLISYLVKAQVPNFGWVNKVGDKMGSYTSSAIDNLGNVYIAGSFYDTVDFDPGPNVYNLISQGSGDFFISKFDSAGNFIWAKSIGSINSETRISISIDNQNNFYLTGRFWGTVDFDPSVGSNQLSTSTGAYYIGKYDMNGSLIWAQKFGIDQVGIALAFSAVDNSGNIYVTGSYYGDLGMPNMQSYGNQDIFLMRFSSNGILNWAKHYGGGLTDVPYSIKIDNNGNLLTSGFHEFYGDFDGDTTFDYNLLGTGGYVLKTAPNGNNIWVKNITGGGSVLRPNALAINSQNEILLTGTFIGAFDFDPGIPVYIFSSYSGNFDIFVLSLNSLGEFNWAKQIGGYLNDEGNGISIDSHGNVYTTGYFTGLVDFDAGSNIYNLSSNYPSAFVSKFSKTGDFIWAGALIGYYVQGNSINLDSQDDVILTGAFSGSTDFDPSNSNYILNGSPSGSSFVEKLNQKTGIDLKFLNQGYYTSNGNMSTVLFDQGISSSINITDSFVISLHNSNPPYELVATNKTTSLINGILNAKFNNLVGNYYVAVNGRNTLETWSSIPLLVGSTPTFYDFTNSQNKAFGNNQVEVELGKWAFYSGDINEDGSIDAFDYLILDPDIISGNSGYLSTDLNGDGSVDAFDYLILDPNIINGISSMTP